MARTFTVTTRTGKIITAPAGAVAAIVAEVIENDCDLQTDYFAHKTGRVVLIGWRYTARENFLALRKAAAIYGPTKHLGPGRDLYSVAQILTADVQMHGDHYWKGCHNPWRRELEQTFTTKAEAEAYIAAQPEPVGIGPATFEWTIAKESIEHRENYSMGGGNYLKAGYRHHDGIRVRSVSWNLTIDAVALALAAAA